VRGGALSGVTVAAKVDLVVVVAVVAMAVAVAVVVVVVVCVCVCVCVCARAGCFRDCALNSHTHHHSMRASTSIF
jgi:type IV secretory pathway VirB3-like protein